MNAPSETTDAPESISLPTGTPDHQDDQGQHHTSSANQPPSTQMSPNEPPPGLSKNAKKRWIKEQRWKVTKEARKKKNKEKKQDRRDQIMKLKIEGTTRFSSRKL